MIFKHLFNALFNAGLAVFFLFSVNAQAAVALSATEQAQLESIQTLLKENPGVLNDVHQSLTHYIQQKERFTDALKDNQAYLYNNPDHVQSGASNPKLVIVNFTDFNCPWCKRLDLELDKLVAAYPQIKLVNLYVPLKEMGGAASGVNSSEYALNVWVSEKKRYTEVHELLMKKPGTHDHLSLTRVAQKTGTNLQLKDQAKSREMIQKNLAIFQQLGLQGTPALLIDDKVLPGFLPFEELERIVKSKLSA